MTIHPRIPVVVTGLLLTGLGLVFLAGLHLGVELRPDVLWPALVIAWGAALLATGLARDDRLADPRDDPHGDPYDDRHLTRHDARPGSPGSEVDIDRNQP